MTLSRQALARMIAGRSPTCGLTILPMIALNGRPQQVKGFYCLVFGNLDQSYSCDGMRARLSQSHL